MGFIQSAPGTLLAPIPAVLVTVGRKTKEDVTETNLLTVAWAGTVCSDPPMVSISVRPERYSYDFIKETGEFVINLTDRAMVEKTDFCGVRSGRDMDKFAACGLTKTAAEGMDFAPAVAQSPLYLACRVEKELPLGSHSMFVARIVSMGVRDDLMDASGRICFEKADLVAYNHGTYYELGKALGFFGFSVAAPEIKKRRMAQLK